MGILKKYDDGFVVARDRYLQFPIKKIQFVKLLKMRMLGYVGESGYWVICYDDSKYFRVPFARNDVWFKALTSEPEFASIGALPQVVLI